MRLEKLIIGAPFGNYLGFKHATSTRGTYTMEFRGGPAYRLWRVLRTVRYYPGIKAWKNKLGLPNPGLCSAVVDGRFPDWSSEILSISARSTGNWLALYDVANGFRPAAIELNVSCPNTPGEVDASDYAQVFTRGVERFADKLVVKLPPVGYEPIVATALAAGVSGFHCCNTLPTPGGGMSGKPLQMLSLAAVRHVRRMCEQQAPRTPVIIGGGGVTCLADARRFLDAGATNVSVASVLFLPWRWPGIRALADNLRYS